MELIQNSVATWVLVIKPFGNNTEGLTDSFIVSYLLVFFDLKLVVTASSICTGQRKQTNKQANKQTNKQTNKQNKSKPTKQWYVSMHTGQPQNCIDITAN